MERERTVSELKAEMKFEIGEIVYMRSAVDGAMAIPEVFGHVVAERFAHECHGGVQRSYFLTTPSGDTLRFIPETSLVSRSEAEQLLADSRAYGMKMRDESEDHRAAREKQRWGLFAENQEKPSEKGSE